MAWCKDIPEKEGKYIVQTKSNVLGIIRTIDATLKFNNNKVSWSFNNQKFYRYLKE